MLQGKRTRKVVAATFLTILVSSTFAPGVSYALTSGPTQPEATSFEPVDTTDMVSLQSGDFTYNIPLLEVPGPDGSYPLSLAYHAGIHTNDEASWVGLGWTLNPGAVNRTVNGLPDDWKGVVNGTQTYWAGDQVSTYGVGVTIGDANGPDNVTFGLQVSQDTYKGFSVGYSVSAFGVSFGKGLYDKSPTLSLGLVNQGFSTAGVSGSAGLYLSTNFKSLTAGVRGSIGVLGESAQGSLASNGKSSTGNNVGAPFFIHSSQTNQVQTSSWGFSNLHVPVVPGLSLNLSASKKRSWINSSTNLKADGTLFQRYDMFFGRDVVYDNYSLLDDPGTYNIYEYPDPTIMQGGAFPDFDNYNVTAQGLGGNMRPYYFQGSLMGQERDNSSSINGVTVNSTTQWFSSNAGGGPTGWRFDGDFSNAFRQNSAAYFYQAANLASTPTDGTVPPFDPSPLFGNTTGASDFGNGTTVNNYGANMNGGSSAVNMSLAGSRHIDVGVKILPYNCPGSPTSPPPSGMINGFSITNESGVTYHYGLPAYAYGEENYQEKIDRSNGLYFNRNTKGGSYAYMWYLTSITGSDFVDRNGDQKADAGDWGYWVNFEYGQWSNSYVWRNPSTGFTRDEDNRFKDCSMGNREVYYLNAIRTRSHIALFEKDLRNDAKGESFVISNKNGSAQNMDYSDTTGTFDINSTQSLKLSKVYLLPIANANLVSTTSGTLNGNVLDRTDVDAVGRAMLESNSLRVIDFNYDYSLCPNTSNSFAFTSGGSPGPLTGKLTLKAVTTRGKAGVLELPGLQFGYDLPNDQLKSAAGTVSPTTFATSNPAFQVGDMLQAGGVYYGVVLSPYNPSTGSYALGNSSMPTGASPVSVTMTTTKNPPFYYNAFDMWGMYKSDYDPPVLAYDENLGRNTTAISAPGTDAWSLRSITTQLGDQIEVSYQPDSYHTVAMNNTPSLVMQNINVVAGSNNGTITFNLANSGPLTNPGAIIQQWAVFSRVQLLVDVNYSGCSGCRYKGAPPASSLTITGVSGSGSSTLYTGVLGTPIPSSNFTGKVWTGNLYVDQASDFYGGGIRVGALAVNHTFDNSVSKVSYAYNTPGSSFSSGTTSYLPVVLDAYDAAQVNFIPPGITYETLSGWGDLYQKALYKNVSGLYPLVRELPPPGVIYQYVTETDQYTNPNPDESGVQRSVAGSAQYQFDVFTPNMVGREPVDPANPIVQGSAATGRNWALRSFTGNIGNIKSITQFDAQGNILKQTINHYLHDGLAGLSFHDFMTQYYALLAGYNYQGSIQERYSELKTIPYNDPSVQQSTTLGGTLNIGGSKATMISREIYPSIQTGQTITDYVKGVKTSSQNLAFDFYSGAVTESLETDAYGNNFMSVTTPAYQLAPYSAMGLKINTDGNLNMLSQTAETKRYKVDGSNTPIGLLSASVTTWSNGFSAMDVDGTQHIQDGRTETVNSATVPNGNVWRQQSTYDWMPVTSTSDGLTPYASFVDFNWPAPSSSDSRWANTSTNTLYDVFSKSLEDVDINGNYSATHMNYGENKVILSGSPANYYEIAYSGAEDAAITNPNTSFIQVVSGTQATGTGVAHTGASSLVLTGGGQKGFQYTAPIVSSGNGGVIAGRSYMAAVWVKPVSGATSTVGLYYDIDGTIKNSASSSTSTKTANGWTLVNLSINGSDIVAGHTLHVFCRNDNATLPAYLDDFRFQPRNATTTAYVYDPFSGELSFILDNNNLYTNFIYDHNGRLTAINKEKLGIGSYTAKQYQYNFSATQYTSAAINTNFAKNNCNTTLGSAGIPMQVTFPAGLANSFISQADADARAASYAQDYVNLHGSCSCQPTFSYTPGIQSTFLTYTLSGTTVNFTYVFNWPSGYGVNALVSVGRINGSCGYPSATRTVPITTAGGVYNVIIGTTGTVQVELISGTVPVPNQTMGFIGTFDLLQNSFYSAAASGTFQRNNCTGGTVGSNYTYSVPAYQYSSLVSQAAADQLAVNDVNANGQNNANVAGTCNPACGFTRDPSIGFQSSFPFTTNGTTITFTLTFPSPSSGYTGGTIGTISGACIPISSFNMQINDQVDPNRRWLVNITSAGVVSISLISGVAPPNAGEIIIGGSFLKTN